MKRKRTRWPLGIERLENRWVLANSLAIDFESSSYSNTFGASYGDGGITYFLMSSTKYMPVVPVENGTLGIEAPSSSTTFYLSGSPTFVQSFFFDASFRVNSTDGPVGDIQGRASIEVELYEKTEGRLASKVGRVRTVHEITDPMERIRYTAPPGQFFFFSHNQFSIGAGPTNSPCDDCSWDVDVHIDNVGFDFYLDPARFPDAALTAIEPYDDSTLVASGNLSNPTKATVAAFDVGLFGLTPSGDVDWSAPLLRNDWPVVNQSDVNQAGEFSAWLPIPTNWMDGYAIVVDADRELDEPDELNNIQIVSPLSVTEIRVTEDLYYVERVNDPIIWSADAPQEFKSIVDAYASSATEDGVTFEIRLSDSWEKTPKRDVRVSWRLFAEGVTEPVATSNEESRFDDLGVAMIPFATPKNVGKYRIEFTAMLFSRDGAQTALGVFEHELIAIAGDPILPLNSYSAKDFNTSYYVPLQQEVRFAAGMGSTKTPAAIETSHTVLKQLTTAIYDLGWTYELRFDEGRPPQEIDHYRKLLANQSDVAACQHYAYAWSHLGRVLGIRTDIRDTRGRFGREFLTIRGLVSSDGKTGNAATPGNTPDRWFFAQHTTGAYTDPVSGEQRLYDPLFGRDYGSADEFVDANLLPFSLTNPLPGYFATDNPSIYVNIVPLYLPALFNAYPNAEYPVGHIEYFLHALPAPPTTGSGIVARVDSELIAFHRGVAKGVELRVELANIDSAEFLWLTAHVEDPNGKIVVSRTHALSSIQAAAAVAPDALGNATGKIQLSGSEFASLGGEGTVVIRVFAPNGNQITESRTPFQDQVGVKFADGGVAVDASVKAKALGEDKLLEQLEIQLNVHGAPAGSQYFMEIRDGNNFVLHQSSGDAETATIALERPWKKAGVGEARLVFGVVKQNGKVKASKETAMALPESWLNSPMYFAPEPADVNGDGLSLVDAFHIIDVARQSGFGSIYSLDLEDAGCVDVNNDERFRVDDVFEVIDALRNLLTADTSSRANGESAAGFLDDSVDNYEYGVDQVIGEIVPVESKDDPFQFLTEPDWAR